MTSYLNREGIKIKNLGNLNIPMINFKITIRMIMKSVKNIFEIGEILLVKYQYLTLFITTH